MTLLTRTKSNILIDAAGHARITDFGFATVARNLDSVRNISSDRGRATRWTPPEILKGEGTYSKEADVFSFAMATIEVRYEWIINTDTRLTVVLYYHRYLPAQFRLTIARI